MATCFYITKRFNPFIVNEEGDIRPALFSSPAVRGGAFFIPPSFFVKPAPSKGAFKNKLLCQ
jgi:hypothetical protein